MLKQIHKITAALLLITALVSISRSAQSDSIQYWVEDISDRETIVIHLIDREFTDAGYLLLITRKLKTVTVTVTAQGRVITLKAPRETNPALAAPTNAQILEFWNPRIGLVMNKIRARINPTAMLEQHDAPGKTR